MRDEIETYAANEIRPFGVNQASVQSHAAYAERLGLPFPLFSDAGVPCLSDDFGLAAAVIELVRNAAREPPRRRRPRSTIWG